MPKSTIVNGNELNTQGQKTIAGVKRLHSLTRFTMQVLKFPPVNVRGKYQCGFVDYGACTDFTIQT
jgi:hypothetical protein